MPRMKKKIVAKDYDSLIQISKERIEKLTSDLKAEKANLKTLEKDSIAYAKQLEVEKKQEELAKLTEMIAASGKSFEEIESFLSSTTKKESKETK